MTPDNPDIGDAYFDAARYATYVWDGFQWVELVTQEEEERRTAKRQMQHFIQQANTYSWTVNGTVVNNRVVNNHVVSNHVVSNHVDHYGVQPNEAWIIPDTTGGTP